MIEEHRFFELEGGKALTDKRYKGQRFKLLKYLYGVYLRFKLKRKTWELCVYFFDKWVELKA